MKKLFITLMSLAIPGSVLAGSLETLKAGAVLNYAPVVSRAVAVSAPVSFTEDRGVSEGNFCFTRSENSQAQDARLPMNFCVSRVSLERKADGKMFLEIVSNNREMKGNTARYVFENGAIKYASAQVFEFFNEIYWGTIELQVPVYPNGNIIPGAEIKVAAKAGLNPPSGDWLWEDVVYSKPKPPAPPVVTGSCFVRAPQEMADGIGMPGKFCIKSLSLVRPADGSMLLALEGGLPGQFGASYVRRGDKTFVRAQLFNEDNSGISGYRGTIVLLAPSYPNGEIDPKGQLLIEATAGYNWDVYHSQWHDEAVKYYSVAD
jgi:hypothetical protein